MRSFCANLHVDPSLPAVSVTSGTHTGLFYEGEASTHGEGHFSDSFSCHYYIENRLRLPVLASLSSPKALAAASPKRPPPTSAPYRRCARLLPRTPGTSGCPGSALHGCALLARLAQ